MTNDHSVTIVLCARIRFLLWASYMQFLLYVGVFIRQGQRFVVPPLHAEDHRVQMRVFTDFEFA